LDPELEADQKKRNSSRFFFRRLGKTFSSMLTTTKSKLMFVAILLIPILFQIVVTGIILFAFKAPGLIAAGDKEGFLKTAAIVTIGIIICMIVVLVDFLIGFYLSVITRQNITEKMEKLYMKDRFYFLFNTMEKNIDNSYDFLSTKFVVINELPWTVGLCLAEL
jgi:ABC-type uncharacterized transport system fused permease/ATPase subunit